MRRTMSPGSSFVGARENGNTIARRDRQDNVREILAAMRKILGVIVDHPVHLYVSTADLFRVFAHRDEGGIIVVEEKRDKRNFI